MVIIDSLLRYFPNIQENFFPDFHLKKGELLLSIFLF